MTLKARAEAAGITTAYGDTPVPPATLRAILNARGGDPLEDGRGPLAACHLPEHLRSAPGWGIFCQLYELRRPGDWGIGDFSHLAEMARIAGAAGADFLGINPVHALFTADAGRASPFSPSNRAFLNPLYIDPSAFGMVAPEDGQERDLIDYPAVAAAKMTALRDAFHRAGPVPDDFLASGGDALLRHALFETLSNALAPAHGARWPDWPDAYHDPASPTVARVAEERALEVAFHIWLQYVARSQLRAAQTAALDAGMRIGLYLDLAVGEDPGGSATWGSATGAGHTLPGLTIGAPPDVFAADGQSWGLAAPSPPKLRATAYAPFRDMIAAQLMDAGALRIDHAMALRQLFLIPEGEHPSKGAHLRYPMHDLIGVLAEESQRSGAIVIGEDLGFVPDGFREAMEAASILSYRILYFEQHKSGFNGPDTYPETALACLSTHDLPVVEGWWHGTDIELRLEHGLVSAADTEAHRAHRAWEKRAVLRLMAKEGLMRPRSRLPRAVPKSLPEAMHRFMARTPCVLTALRLADAVGPDQPTNVPGTTHGHPNWRPRSPTPLDRIADHPAFRTLTAALREERPRP